jgi:hypothetical protein
MAASREDISGWFDSGVAEKQAYLIVVCDTFDHEDYPVYANDEVECFSIYNEHNGKDMQRIMEVYNLGQPKDEQMNEHRCMRLPQRKVGAC